MAKLTALEKQYRELEEAMRNLKLASDDLEARSRRQLVLILQKILSKNKKSNDEFLDELCRDIVEVIEHLSWY